MASDPEQIKREIEDIRAELADTVDELSQRMHPKAVAGRGVTATRAWFGLPTSENPGSTAVAQRVRWDRVGLVAGGAVLLLARRRRRKRRNKS